MHNSSSSRTCHLAWVLNTDWLLWIVHSWDLALNVLTICLLQLLELTLSSKAELVLQQVVLRSEKLWFSVEFSFSWELKMVFAQLHPLYNIWLCREDILRKRGGRPNDLVFIGSQRFCHLLWLFWVKNFQEECAMAHQSFRGKSAD